MKIIEVMDVDGAVLENVDAIRNVNMQPVFQYVLCTQHKLNFKVSILISMAEFTSFRSKLLALQVQLCVGSMHAHDTAYQQQC